MILVRLMGGLGNQMFQYAFGRFLAEKNGVELKYDLGLMMDRSRPHELVTHRQYELDIFQIRNFKQASEEEVCLFNGIPNPTFSERLGYKWRLFSGQVRLVLQQNNEFKESFLSIPDQSCLVGRWQSEKFFAPIAEHIRTEFSFISEFSDPIIQKRKELKEFNSVGIHIRRGDLVTSALYSKTIGVLDLDYYNKGIEAIKSRISDPVFYVFSDDTEWCKKELKLSVPFEVIGEDLSGTHASGHMYLLSACKHQIISNSTFAWWAAWLNTSMKKTVIGPKNWYRDEKLANEVLFPKDWIVL